MKEIKKDGYEIEELVFRVFMKHVKANKLYIAFRWSVNHNDRTKSKDIIHTLSRNMCRDRYCKSLDMMGRIGCGFTNASSIDSILEIMRNMNGKKKLTVSNDGDFQMEIMHMVNNLVHSCIEHALHKDIRKIEKIGSAIFEECCQKLIGDSFVDKTNDMMVPKDQEVINKMVEMGLPPNMEFLEQLKTQLFERLNRRDENQDDFDLRFNSPWIPDCTPIYDDDLDWTNNY